MINIEKLTQITKTTLWHQSAQIHIRTDTNFVGYIFQSSDINITVIVNDKIIIKV